MYGIAFVACNTIHFCTLFRLVFLFLLCIDSMSASVLSQSAQSNKQKCPEFEFSVQIWHWNFLCSLLILYIHVDKNFIIRWMHIFSCIQKILKTFKSSRSSITMMLHEWKTMICILQVWRTWASSLSFLRGYWRFVPRTDWRFRLPDLCCFAADTGVLCALSHDCWFDWPPIPDLHWGPDRGGDPAQA